MKRWLLGLLVALSACGQPAAESFQSHFTAAQQAGAQLSSAGSLTRVTIHVAADGTATEDFTFSVPDAAGGQQDYRCRYAAGCAYQPLGGASAAVAFPPDTTVGEYAELIATARADFNIAAEAYPEVDLLLLPGASPQISQHTGLPIDGTSPVWKLTFFSPSESDGPGLIWLTALDHPRRLGGFNMQ